MSEKPNEQQTSPAESFEQKEARRLGHLMLDAASQLLSEREDWQEVPMRLLTAAAQRGKMELETLIQNKGIEQVSGAEVRTNISDKNKLANKVVSILWLWGCELTHEDTGLPEEKRVPANSGWDNADMEAIRVKFGDILPGRPLRKILIEKLSTLS